MRSRSGSYKNQLVFIYPIYEQPIGLYVTFAMSGIITCQIMVMVFQVKWLFFKKRLYDLIHKR